MDLLKYLEPMKNLPERFSNLAFWRGVRKLRDEVVNAFEYVDSWGDGIELNISALRNYKISSYQSPTFDAYSTSHTMVLGFNDSQHWCKLTLNNVTLAKKPIKLLFLWELVSISSPAIQQLVIMYHYLLHGVELVAHR